MTHLNSLFAPTFAILMLVATPILTLVLMRRAGIRGLTLALAFLPAVFLFLGGYAFYWFMDSGLAQSMSMNGLMSVVIAKNIGVFIGAISPLLLLAILKWPVLDNTRLNVEPSK
jgi:hypothetical protein